MSYSKQFVRLYKRWAEGSSKEIQDYLAAEITSFKKNLKAGSCVLDVGCGYGRVLKALASRKYDLWGIDNSPHQIRYAKAYLRGIKHIHLILGDARDMQFPDNYFDYALFTGNTFGNLGRAKLPILREVKRVLRHGGHIFISVYNKKKHTFDIRTDSYKKANVSIYSIFPHSRKVSIRIGEGGSKERIVSEQFSPRELRTILRKAGFRARVRPLTTISYMCDAIKP